MSCSRAATTGAVALSAVRSLDHRARYAIASTACVRRVFLLDGSLGRGVHSRFMVLLRAGVFGRLADTFSMAGWIGRNARRSASCVFELSAGMTGMSQVRAAMSRAGRSIARTFGKLGQEMPRSHNTEGRRRCSVSGGMIRVTPRANA